VKVVDDKDRRDKIIESLLWFSLALLVGFVGGIRGWW